MVVSPDDDWLLWTTSTTHRFLKEHPYMHPTDHEAVTASDGADDDNNDNDYEESSIGGKLLYLIFGIIWMCVICQLASQYKVRERRERQAREQAAAAAVLALPMDDLFQRSENRRAQLQFLFVHRKVVRVIQADHLKPEPQQIVVLDDDDLEESSRQDTTTTTKEEEPISNNKDQETNVDLKPSETTETSDSTAVVVLEQDNDNDNDNNDHDDVLDLESGMFSLDQQQQNAAGILELPDYSVSNGCAICLDLYQAGEMVVWSSNAKCQHAFHQECILDYFVSLRSHHKLSIKEEEDADNNTPCPCCRQDFVCIGIEKQQTRR
jgi:hypothetical protein